MLLRQRQVNEIFTEKTKINILYYISILLNT